MNLHSQRTPRYFYMVQEPHQCKSMFFHLICQDNKEYQLSNLQQRQLVRKKLYFHIHHYLAPIGVAALALFILFISSTVFNAGSYSEILKVKESDFAADLADCPGVHLLFHLHRR